MEHIDCVKAWPAAYAVMAAIMDDLQVSEQVAIKKWSAEAVNCARQRHDGPIKPAELHVLFGGIVHNLGAGFKVVPADAPDATPAAVAQHAAQAQAAAGIPAKDQPYPKATNPGGYVPPSNSKARKPMRFEAIVTEVFTTKKDARWGGGVRHMMRLRIKGDRSDNLQPIEGSIPSAAVGKVQVHDIISLEAQVWAWADKPGWFKYPKGLSVLKNAGV
jgi:hypothetical protein